MPRVVGESTTNERKLYWTTNAQLGVETRSQSTRGGASVEVSRRPVVVERASSTDSDSSLWRFAGSCARPSRAPGGLWESESGALRRLHGQTVRRRRTTAPLMMACRTRLRPSLPSTLPHSDLLTLCSSHTDRARGMPFSPCTHLGSGAGLSSGVRHLSLKQYF
uniref:Uncharacterized protein n=1 Tax=Plectus sambesii TaxID=2011161 RepID=A0A914VA75_9BILA